MKYTLKSGLASFEGEPMGEKEVIFPASRKGVESALKEALEALAENKEIIEDLEQQVEDLGYQVMDALERRMRL